MENHKGNLVFVALLLIAVIFVSGCAGNGGQVNEALTDKTQSAVQFEIYENSDFDIAIDYPSDWDVSEQVPGAIVAFLSPIESDSDIFRENLNIILQDLSDNPMTLDEYTALSLKQAEQLLTDFKLIESNAAALAGNPAHKIIYTATQGQYNLKVMQSYTIKNDVVYLLTYTAEVDGYQISLETAQQIIDSFRIVG